jgi:hypothetical protein
MRTEETSRLDNQFHQSDESDENAGEFKAKTGPTTPLQRIAKSRAR